MIGLAVVFTMAAAGVHHHHQGELMYLPQEECCDGTNSEQHEDRETSDHTQHYLASTHIKLDIAVHAEKPQHGLSDILLYCSCIPSDCLQLFIPSHLTSRHHSTTHRYLSRQRRSSGLRAPPCIG